MRPVFNQIEKAAERVVELMHPRINDWHAQRAADLEFTRQVVMILRKRWAGKVRN